MVKRERIIFARKHAKEMLDAVENDEIIMIHKSGLKDFFLAAGLKSKAILFRKNIVNE